jgi:hypothetical protein
VRSYRSAITHRAPRQPLRTPAPTRKTANYVRERVGSWHDEHLVHIAPEPMLARLEGSNDGMTCRREMLRRVAPRRVVTAPNMTASHAHPEMYPIPTAGCQAVLTSQYRWRLRTYRTEMRADPRHRFIPLVRLNHALSMRILSLTAGAVRHTTRARRPDRSISSARFFHHDRHGHPRHDDVLPFV